MGRLALALILMAAVLPASAAPAQHSDAPVDIRVGISPQPVMADGKRHLLYELQVTNYGRGAGELTHLTVADDNNRPLADFDDAAIEKLAAPVGAADNPNRVRVLQTGRGLELFMDVALDPAAAVPHRLHHRFSVDAHWRDGSVSHEAVGDIVVPVSGSPPPVLHAPLAGAGWVAANALSAPGHRRAVAVVDGKARIAQRFAIDWVRLGPDGRAFHGDPTINADYYGYGADVLAVADGRVVEIKDSLPENAGSKPQRAGPVTLDTIAGNYLILDIGGGRFGVYAHLQPRGFAVKADDRVRAGQVLAKLGNSGNADAPHLHFHLADAPSNLGAEGIPYELTAFSQVGVVDDLETLLSGQAWTAPKRPAAPQRKAFPLNNAVLVLP